MELIKYMPPRICAEVYPDVDTWGTRSSEDETSGFE